MKHHKPKLTRKQLVDAIAPYYDGPRRDLWEMSKPRIHKIYKEVMLKSFVKLMSEKLN